MPQKVKIKVDSLQMEGQEKNRISYQVDGNLYDKKGTYYLKYKENLEGLKGVETTLKVKEDKLTLIREGQVRMIQEFMPNKRSSFDYYTPYGTLSFEVEVEKLNIDINLSQGMIDLNYRLYSGTEIISKNQLNINYKEE